MSTDEVLAAMGRRFDSLGEGWKIIFSILLTVSVMGAFSGWVAAMIHYTVFTSCITGFCSVMGLLALLLPRAKDFEPPVPPAPDKIHEPGVYVDAGGRNHIIEKIEDNVAKTNRSYMSFDAKTGACLNGFTKSPGLDPDSYNIVKRFEPKN